MSIDPTGESAPGSTRDLAAALKQFHSDFGSQVTDPEFIFFNYGMADGGVQLADQPYQQHLNLIQTLIAPIELAGATVLEVGSGRGGNCHFLRRHTQARRICGLDLCSSYVDFSRRAFSDERLMFIQGDAEALPFVRESTDCVLSIQSAHCYSRFESFLKETYRILKPGGFLGLADIWDLELFPLDWRARERQLLECGLTVIAQRDITREVSEALALTNGFAASMARTRTESNAPLLDSMADGLRTIQRSLAERRCSYRLYTLGKPPRTRLS
jgi:SAM-dependent methyltransferase